MFFWAFPDDFVDIFADDFVDIFADDFVDIFAAWKVIYIVVLSCRGMKIGTLTRFTVSAHFFCLFLGSLFSKQKVAVEPILQKLHIIHWLFAWRNLLCCYVV